MTVSQRLEELGLTLPAVARPVAAYVPAVKVGNLVQTSGQLPTVDGQVVCEGRLGTRAVAEPQAVEAARVAALNALAAAADAAGGVDNLKRVVKVTGYVACTEDFFAQPSIIDGASNLLQDLFGSPHARSAVGVMALPLNVCVEIEVLFEAHSDVEA